MYNIEELKGKISLAASTLGIDLNLDGTDLPMTDLCVLKRTLIEDFKIDPVVSTFVTNTLKDGIDFDWLEMYKDKRALYQINLGIIQGIDMSFSKKDEYTSLQLEAIRQWTKRGVDMSDISFPTLSHKNIRALAAVKQAGFDYIPLISINYSAGYIRKYLEVYKMIVNIDQKDIFLRVGNVTNSKGLLENGFDLTRLKLISFFEANGEDQKNILGALGIAIKRGYLRRLKALFENIEIFSLQDFLMINQLLNLEDFEKLKAEKVNSSTLVFKSLGIDNPNGNPAIYDAFFEKNINCYMDARKMECIRFGLDFTPFLKSSIDDIVRNCVFNITHEMIETNYGLIKITEALKTLEKAINCLKNPRNVLRKLKNVTSFLSNFDYLDFNVLLDKSISEDLKIEGMLAKHLKCDIAIVKNKNLSFFAQADLFKKPIHKDVREIFIKNKKLDNAIEYLNDAADSIDVLRLNLNNLCVQNVKVLACFNYLKNESGFYELANANFFGTAIFLGLDALDLGLDVLPIIKHNNGYYAENMLKNMIENHLKTSNYVSCSETAYKTYDSDSAMLPF